MAEPNALAFLIDLAQRQSDERVKRLADAIQRESSNDKRLALLVEYRGDYWRAFEEAQRTGLSAAALVNFHHFLQKLDAAVEQQRTIVHQAKALSANARLAYSEAERKRQSLVTLKDRRVAAARVREARRDQGRQDEVAQRLAQHGSGIERNEK